MHFFFYSHNFDTVTVKNTMVKLEIDIMHYEKMIKQLIEIAETLQKDNKQLYGHFSRKIRTIEPDIKSCKSENMKVITELTELPRRIEKLEKAEINQQMVK